MKPSICAGFDYNIPFDKAVELIHNAGFDTISLGALPAHSGYLIPGGTMRIKNLLKLYDIHIDSVHGPSPYGDMLFSIDNACWDDAIDKCCMAIQTADELDGRIVVLHLLLPYDIPHDANRLKMIDKGRAAVEKLLAYAKKFNVKLALENGQRADYDAILTDLLNEFDDEYVGLCYDSGHEHVYGACFNMLERFGDRLLTLHLHDNTGVDNHMLPFEGNIPWGKFCDIFRTLPYKGNFQLETDIHMSRFDDPKEFLADAMKCSQKLMADSGLL